MVGAFFFWMSLYVFVPTLPLYAQSKTDSLALVGLALAQYGLWQALLRFPLGMGADWLGRRKPFILAGFVLLALGAWIMGSAASITGIAAGRAVTGLAASSWVVMVVAYSGLFPPAEATRAAATLTLVNSLAQGAASLASGPLTAVGGYAAGFTAAMAAAGAGLLVWLPGAETRLPPLRLSPVSIRRLVLRKDVLGPALLNAVQQYAVFAAIFGFTPILAERFGATAFQISLLTTTNIAANVVGNLLASFLVRYAGERPLVYASFALLAAGLALTAAAPGLAWLYAAQIFMGVGGGIGYPLLLGLSITRVKEGERNTAMGLHQAVYGIGMFAGPWLSGLLAVPLGIQPMFAVTAGLVLAIGILGNWRVNKE
jgi:MFS family permease